MTRASQTSLPKLTGCCDEPLSQPPTPTTYTIDSSLRCYEPRGWAHVYSSPLAGVRAELRCWFNYSNRIQITRLTIHN